MAIIDKPSDYFNTKLYTGNGGTQSITGLDFAPDFVWLKSRTQGGTGYNGMHYLFDTIRGATKRVRANDNSAEATSSASLTSFNSDGFTLGSDDIVNFNGDAFVSWNWKAGGTASSNTDGSITSSVSANQDAGFSIVSWTGNGTNPSTIGHGLGTTPKMFIVKNRSDSANWVVYNEVLGNTKAVYLDLTDASGTVGAWNNTSPTSSVFTVNGANALNGSSDNMIAYCFAEKQGYSKFGSYTGNGSTDGTFVYTGFKPAWILWKRSDDSTGRDWQIYDNKRSTYNELNKRLRANTADAETTSTGMDFTSNGFKLRTSDGNYNASGANYIFMCFAENPFVSSTGVPATAR